MIYRVVSLVTAPLVWVCLGFIWLWQKVFWRMFGVQCRYVPSCSEYTAEALRRHGFFWGLFLGLKRICRCNSLFEGGIDPVPDSLSFLDR